MTVSEIKRVLRDAGFKFIGEGTKHSIYEKDGDRIIVSRTYKLSPHLQKSILSRIRQHEKKKARNQNVIHHTLRSFGR